MRWLYLIIAIFGEVIGTSSLKMAAGFTKLVPSIVVVVGYSVAFYFLSLSLKYIPLVIAYAIWCGVGIVLVALIGWIFYKQVMDVPAIMGMALIFTGVLVINLFSRSVTH